MVIVRSVACPGLVLVAGGSASIASAVRFRAPDCSRPPTYCVCAAGQDTMGDVAAGSKADSQA